MREQELLEKITLVQKQPFDLPFDPVEIINEALFHTNDELRLQALKLAAAYKSPQLIKPLFHLAATEINSVLQKRAIAALGELLHEGKLYDFHLVNRPASPDGESPTAGLTCHQFQAIREFFRHLTLDEDSPPEIRTTALLQLAPVANSEISALIDRFYYSSEPELTRGAIKAIGRLEHGDWMEIILEELTNFYGAERILAAVEAAGRHNIREAGPELARLLENSDDRALRLAALNSLAGIDWSEAKNHLERYVKDSDPEIRKAAESALTRP